MGNTTSQIEAENQDISTSPAKFEDLDGHSKISQQLVASRINSLGSESGIGGLLITASSVFLSQDVRFVIRIAYYGALAFSLACAASGSILIYRLHGSLIQYLQYADRPLKKELASRVEGQHEEHLRAGNSRFYILERLQSSSRVVHVTLALSIACFLLGLVLSMWKDSHLLNRAPTTDTTSNIAFAICATCVVLGIAAIPLGTFISTGILFAIEELKLGEELDLQLDTWHFLYRPKLKRGHHKKLTRCLFSPIRSYAAWKYEVMDVVIPPPPTVPAAVESVEPDSDPAETTPLLRRTTELRATV